LIGTAPIEPGTRLTTTVKPLTPVEILPQPLPPWGSTGWPVEPQSNRQPVDAMVLDRPTVQARHPSDGEACQIKPLTRFDVRVGGPFSATADRGEILTLPFCSQSAKAAILRDRRRNEFIQGRSAGQAPLQARARMSNRHALPLVLPRCRA
jgi:hypothetical protein